MELRAVECTQEFWEFVRILRNDPRVLDGFLERAEITRDAQVIYMTKYADCYRIALADGEPAGYAGVVDNDIRVCTHPDYQRRGVGRFLTREIVRVFPAARARVKVENEASLRLFRALGFTEELVVFKPPG